MSERANQYNPRSCDEIEELGETLVAQGQARRTDRKSARPVKYLCEIKVEPARALLEFAVEEGDGTLLIRERLSRQDIAKMVGASREMVSRVMKDLEERGFIQTQDDGAIAVKDRLTTLN